MERTGTNAVTDANSNPISVPPSTNTVVSSVTLTVAETRDHKVLVVGQFSVDGQSSRNQAVVGDVQIDGNTILNTQLNSPAKRLGALVAVSGIVPLAPGTHRLDLRVYTTGPSVTVHHRTLSAIDLEASLLSTVNVRDYGAAGDGVNDDRQAFIDAFTAARASGKPVFVPAGTYAVDVNGVGGGGALYLDGDVTFYGEGKDKSVVKMTGYVAPGTNGSTLFYVQSGRNVTFRGLQLEGPTSGITSNNDVCFGIFSEGGGGLVTVEDCQMWRFTQSIKISYDPSGIGGKLHVRRSFMRARGQAVLHAAGTSTADGARDAMESIYEDCTFRVDDDPVPEAGSGYNLYIDSSVSTRVLRCRFLGATGRSIRRGTVGALKARFNQYVDCYAEWFQIGFESAGPLNHTEIIGCTFESPPSDVSWVAWAPSTAYTAGQRRSSGDKIYEVITPGTSAGSAGPTGTGSDIVDGTVRWKFVWHKVDPGATVIPQGKTTIVGCSFGIAAGAGQTMIDSNFGGGPAEVKVIGCSFNAGYGATGGNLITNIFTNVTKPWTFENCDFYDNGAGFATILWLNGRLELTNCRFYATTPTSVARIRGGYVSFRNCYTAATKPLCFVEATFGQAVEIELIGVTGGPGSIPLQLNSPVNTSPVVVHGHSNRFFEPSVGSHGGSVYIYGSTLLTGDMQFGHGVGTSVRNGAGPYLFQANWNRDVYELAWASTPTFSDIEIADGNGSPHPDASCITTGRITLIAKNAFTLQHDRTNAGVTPGTDHSKILLRGEADKTVATNESIVLWKCPVLKAWLEVS